MAARAKLKRGGSLHVLGIGCAGHNAGAGLVEASKEGGIQVIANHEEERFRGIKHFKQFPSHSIEAACADLRKRGLGVDDLDAVVTTWDYIELGSQLAGHIAGELPGSLTMLRSAASPTFCFRDVCHAFRASTLLGRQLGTGKPHPVINLRHHDNHAYLALGLSPFAGSTSPVLVAVIDGLGDDSSISLYRSDAGKLERFYTTDSIFDSIGQMYLYISSSQGGWPPLSSEGRYMGAAAWGNSDRMTNPYYRALRELFHFGPNGKLQLNRKLANWHRRGSLHPYCGQLTEIIGPPILPDQMWNPDHVLRVEDIQHAPITQDRVDKAAATQMLFEDAVLHIFDYGIRCTQASQAVFAGGAALNCVASMRILEHFGKEWYQRYLGKEDTQLHIWVPPIPGDAGAPVGAAYHFACLAGAKMGAPGTTLRHPFLCGHAPTQAEIDAAIGNDPEIDFLRVGSICAGDQTAELADLMAYIVSQDGVIGIFQGAAETGPRALGHRSILANPTNPDTLQTLNERVKFREIIRPLAPMATREAAERLFELAAGASDDDHNAYNYMVLTATARVEAYHRVPDVVHRDGTARVQIVRAEVDPLMHAYLKAMGRRVGVEVSVNTSLNVGSPIAQTPEQALQALKKSRGLHGVFMVADDGACQVAWHNVKSGFKDGGCQLRWWIQEWRTERQRETGDDRLDVSPPSPVGGERLSTATWKRAA